MQISFSRLRIVILGYIVRGPLGGLVWHHLQYVLGLKKMGHDVLFIEDSDDYISCYNPVSNEMTTDPTYGIKFIKEIFEEFDLADKWAYYDAHRDIWFGQSQKKVREFCITADFLLNISCVNPLRETTLKISRRVLLDTDPAFTQLRHLTEPTALQKAKTHTHFFSFGENFGKPFCKIPDDGLNWISTRQPVVADAWEKTEGNPHSPLTTVMQWDSYKEKEYNGRSFGMKSKSFTKYMDLPKYSTEAFELAIGSSTKPGELLQKKGWRLSDSTLITKTPKSYQHFIKNSKAEWSVAKAGYVVSNSGWFSERSTCYLASGRPVIVEDTGFSNIFETGRGLLSFTTMEEAIACIEEMNRNYTRHCQWAIEIVEQYFSYTTVLTTLLKNIYQSPPRIILPEKK